MDRLTILTVAVTILMLMLLMSCTSIEADDYSTKLTTQYATLPALQKQ